MSDWDPIYVVSVMAVLGMLWTLWIVFKRKR